MLRAARARLIVATGDAKARPAAALLTGRDPAVPASLVGPGATELLIDPAAAAQAAATWAAARGGARSVTSSRMTCAIIGSFRKHYSTVLAVADEFEQRGITVASPPRSEIVCREVNFVRLLVDDPEASDEEIQLIALHRILSSDFVFVLVVDGYVGPSTAYEIGRLIERRVPVFFSERPSDLPMPIPEWSIVDAASLAADPPGMLAAVARISDDDRVQELHEDLLAERFRRDAPVRRSRIS
jgi:hypothetical protein